MCARHDGDDGVWSGLRYRQHHRSGVNEWLGIPYAAPPVGTLRWQPPQPPTPWTATLQATAVRQRVHSNYGVAGSENCLFVNVWAPANATATSDLPVMVHIHGGGFTDGNGNADNSLLASTGDEVIVSMNYRLNIFGFLADDKALGSNSGDYGLKDQQFSAALGAEQRGGVRWRSEQGDDLRRVRRRVKPCAI